MEEGLIPTEKRQVKFRSDNLLGENMESQKGQQVLALNMDLRREKCSISNLIIKITISF